MSPPFCNVCGHAGLADQPVIWPKLASEWRLSPAEIAYVDRQQGTHCTGCGSNLRSMALAKAIATALGSPGQVLKTALAASTRQGLLEINEAGQLTAHLRGAPGYVFGGFPQVDMHDLPFPDATFDLVVHSDTLEHVAHPVRALAECRRVLRPGGACCYTVPIIVDRMTAGREGLPASHHGSQGADGDDLRVVTEYGADAWRQGVEAGFSRVSIETVDFPSAIALALYRD